MAHEQPPALHQRLTPIARFVGQWRGTTEGEPGRGTVERTYTPILNGRFIEERNTSTYPPQPSNAAGEIHHHLAFWSFDRGRSRFVLRQFHVERFVNQFVSSTADFVSDQLVVDSEALENLPAGYRARETYRFGSADAFEEIFEIAEPGSDAYQVYSHNRFLRTA